MSAQRLFATNYAQGDVALLVLRLALAIVLFPHGAQKMLGWFGGPGFGGPLPGTNGRQNNLMPASDRDKRREDFLDTMSAPQRAALTEFRKDLGARRQQLGLPSDGRP